MEHKMVYPPLLPFREKSNYERSHFQLPPLEKFSFSVPGFGQLSEMAINLYQ